MKNQDLVSFILCPSFWEGDVLSIGIYIVVEEWTRAVSRLPVACIALFVTVTVMVISL